MKSNDVKKEINSRKDRKELISLRTKNTKYYINPDKSIVAEVYKENIHYKVGNNFEEIDNSLIKTEYGYKNRKNDFNVLFYTKDDEKKLVTVEINNKKISMYLKNNNKKIIEKKILKKTFTKTNDNLIFKNILDNVDIRYDINSNKLKETIIINKKIRSNVFSFIIESLQQLVLNKDNSISILDEEKEVLRIEKPFMVDNDNYYSEAITCNLSVIDKGKYELSISLDEQWMNSKDRKYPIIIDPTISNVNSESSVIDTYIYDGDSNVSTYNEDVLKVGTDSSNKKYRSLLKFELPTIPANYKMVSASLCLGCYFDEEADLNPNNPLISIHKITQSWIESTAKWATISDKYDSKVENYFYADRTPYESGTLAALVTINTDITNIVEQWYNGEPNNGLMLKQYEESYLSDGKIGRFFSKDNNVNGDNPKPRLIITYRNFNGMEERFSYTSFDHYFGDCHLNNYTGNLVTIFNLGNTLGGSFPANLYLVNSCGSSINNFDIGLGKGNKLNLYQTLIFETIESQEYIKYLDSDFTEHYFYKLDNIYHDEDGLSLKIVFENNSYVMTDKDNNKYIFINLNDGNTYFLSELIDGFGNKILINYDSNNRISNIVDSLNGTISVIYQDNKILFNSPHMTTTIVIENNLLTNITSFNKTESIEYGEHNLITKIINPDNTSLNIEYLNNLTYKVKKIVEKGKNNSIGRILEYKYNLNSTTIIDNDGLTNTFVFNKFGNITSLSSMDKNLKLSNSYGKSVNYENISNITKLSLDTNLSKYVSNYIIGSSFENGGQYLIADGNMICEPYNDAHYGSIAYRIENYNLPSIAYQTFSIPKGATYTFSFYSKGNINYKAYVEFDSYKKEIEILASQEYNRYSITFDYLETISDDIKVCFQPLEIGEIFIDDMQLEEGEIANNYNFIDNSNFVNGLSNWEAYTFKDGNEVSLQVEVVEVDGEKALKLKNNPSIINNVSKIIYSSGKAGDVYSLSFWYKNEGADFFPTEFNNYAFANIAVHLGFNYTNGEMDYIDIEKCMLSGFNTEWNYCTMKFVAQYDYDSITLSISDNMNFNDCYITNFNLFKDISSYSYKYDDNGNIISSLDLSGNETSFEYDDNNQLINLSLPNGANFFYEYDNNTPTKLLRLLSPTGIRNEVVYDNYGNATSIDSKYTQSTNEIYINKPYNIRLKGTNNYFSVNSTNTVDTSDRNTASVFIFTLTDDNYMILAYSGVENGYLVIKNNQLVVENRETIQDDMKFELIANSNRSFTFLPLLIDNVALTFDNGNIVLDTYRALDTQSFFVEREDTQLFVKNSITYTEDGKYIRTVSDDCGNITTFNTNEKGLTTSIVDANNSTTSYTYDANNLVTKITKNGKEVSYTYAGDKLSKITYGNDNYIFNYDEFNNISDIMLNNQSLITNYYDLNNGNIIKKVYGNNSEINYSYDSLNRISNIITSLGNYKHYYDCFGRLAKLVSNTDYYLYEYDFADRICSYTNGNFCAKYTYDNNNHIVGKRDIYLETDKSYTFNLNKDSQITKILIDNNVFDYYYDELGRLYEQRINNSYVMRYDYKTNENETSGLVTKLYDNGFEYNYEYDNVRNLTGIYLGTQKQKEYFYDLDNQLIKENNINTNDNSTIEYTYDAYGNILTKKKYTYNTTDLISTDSFTYGNSNWQDLLTKVNNENIIYDAIGNPINIGNKILTWVNGRELRSYVDGNKNITYDYNLDGIRTSKTVNGVVTKYCVEGTQIIFEDRNGNVIYYIYNGTELLGFIYNGSTYYYKKNLFGDIIGIIDTNYNDLVFYEYDSWGAINRIFDYSGIGLSTINPFRYRSYYYDEETELYYLNSRYYNPKWGRFINADITVSTGQGYFGHNMFGYCGNNPIVRTDRNGEGWLLFAATMAVVGGTISAAFRAGTLIAAGKPLDGSVWGAFVGGAVGGFFATTPFGLSGTSSAIIGAYGGAFAESVVNQAFEDEFCGEQVFIDTALNGSLSMVIESDIKVNSGWKKPQSVKTSLTGSYGSKLTKKMTIETYKTTSINNVVSGATDGYKKAKQITFKKKSNYVPKKTLSTDPKVIQQRKKEKAAFDAVVKAIQKDLKNGVCYIK